MAHVATLAAAVRRDSCLDYSGLVRFVLVSICRNHPDYVSDLREVFQALNYLLEDGTIPVQQVSI